MVTRARLVRRRAGAAPRPRAWIALHPEPGPGRVGPPPVVRDHARRCPGSRPRPARTSAPAGSRSRPRSHSGCASATRCSPLRSRLDLLAVVEEVRHVVRAASGTVTARCSASATPGLHVGGAAAVHQVAVASVRREVVVRAARCPGARRAPPAAAGRGRCARITVLPSRSTRQVRRARSAASTAVGDLLLVAGDRLDVDQGPGQRDRVGEDLAGSAGWPWRTVPLPAARGRAPGSPRSVAAGEPP